MVLLTTKRSKNKYSLYQHPFQKIIYTKVFNKKSLNWGLNILYTVWMKQKADKYFIRTYGFIKHKAESIMTYIQMAVAPGYWQGNKYVGYSQRHSSQLTVFIPVRLSPSPFIPYNWVLTHVWHRLWTSLTHRFQGTRWTFGH